MPISSQHYAQLSEFAYDPPKPNADGNRIAEIDGIKYQVVKMVDRPSGYQGIIFQREGTNEIVVAHRGTEFTGQFFRDVVGADGGMVARRVNLQTEDALELTREAMRYSSAQGSHPGAGPQVTVTGHSLGGCLAQIAAARLNLNGETFNPYGAAALGLRIPEGGNQVVNHVMAADMVSSAGKHFGEVRVYAKQSDIKMIAAGDYANNDRQLFDQRNPLMTAGGGLASHSLHHFRDVDGNDQPDVSVLRDLKAQQRAEEFGPMIEKYRGDVWMLREGISVGSSILRGPQGVAEEIIRQLPDKVRSPFEGASGVLPERGTPGDPRDKSHPDHPMHESIRTGVARIQTEQGNPFDESGERIAASLLVAAKQSGLNRVDHVLPGGSVTSGENVFAVQGQPRDPTHLRAQVSVAVASQTPVSESFNQLENVNQRAPQAAAPNESQEQARAGATRAV